VDLAEFLKYIFYYFAKTIIGIVFVIYFRVKSYGKENIPKKGRLIVAANHSSYLDPFILGIIFPRRIRYIMTSTYYEKKILKPFCYLLDTIPIGSNSQVSAYKKTMRFLAKEKVIGIFPEGQRSREGYLLDARKGVGVYALRSKAPILPVAIVGAREALPPHSKIPKPAKVKIFYGKPIKFEGDILPEEISDTIKKEIAKLFIENGYEDYVKKEDREEVN
jgi:1-acyl-sn-glycerol-3-phosphate acyltransferase